MCDQRVHASFLKGEGKKKEKKGQWCSDSTRSWEPTEVRCNWVCSHHLDESSDHYVLGFAHALSALLQSQILCQLYKCPSDETEVPHVHRHWKRSRAQVKYPVVYVRVQLIMETFKQPTRHWKKCSESAQGQRIKNYVKATMVLITTTLISNTSQL